MTYLDLDDGGRIVDFGHYGQDTSGRCAVEVRAYPVGKARYMVAGLKHQSFNQDLDFAAGNGVLWDNCFDRRGRHQPFRVYAYRQWVSNAVILTDWRCALFTGFAVSDKILMATLRVDPTAIETPIDPSKLCLIESTIFCEWQ